MHVTGLAPFMHGRPVVSLGPLGYRDRALMADFWRIIEHYRVTSFSGVPTVYASLSPVPDDVDLSSLRAGAVGAAPLPRAVRSGFERSAKVPMLEGYGVLMVTAQLRLLPAFARLPFAPSFWAFTFSWTAVATSALHWLHILHPPGHLVYGYLTLTAITLLIGGIALPTVLSARPVSRTPVRPSPAK